MAIELTATERAALQALCRKYAVKRLRLFGSATTARFDPASSDLDFSVDFDDPVPGMRLSTQYFGLLDELQTLFGRHVDLLEESAIENTRLKQSVADTAVTLYAA